MSPGDVLEIESGYAEVIGRVPAGSVMVDGLGVGDVEDLVLRDRMHLAQDGIVMAVVGIDVNSKEIVSGPDIFSRGFAAEEHVEEILEDAKDVVINKLNELAETDSLTESDEVKAGCKKALAKFIYNRTHRRPMVVPIIMEV